MKKTLLVWVLALITTMVWCCALAEETAGSYEIITDIAYMDDGSKDHLLDVYGVTDSDTIKPVMIEIHGGGFIGGTKKSNADHSMMYADAGYMVVTPNYTRLPKGDFRTVLQDVFAAMHWVEKNAEAYHFDTEHIFMGGDSAGACIVSLAASCLTNERTRGYYGVELPEYTIKGFVLSCPTVDILSIRGDLGKEGALGHKANTIGEDILFDDELMNMAHVFNLLDENYPPVYIITTPTDELFYWMSEEFDEALTSAGIAHEYHVYTGAENTLGHVFNVTNVEFAESICANQEALEYLSGLCKP